ncbi:hypothetical protein PHYC_03936 [Phycisphaerales bacterium]|nr:hypothetical protein PHYC_03936 [Phycisphaerales bacterium]
MPCSPARRAGFAAFLVAAAGLGIVLAARIGLLWSDGAGRLWGLTSGGWTSITLMPGTAKPASGFWVGAQRNAVGNLLVGGQQLTPQRSSGLSLPVLLIPAVAIGAGAVVSISRRASRATWQCSCGYDRRGLKAGASCPECGRAPSGVSPIIRPA